MDCGLLDQKSFAVYGSMFSLHLKVKAAYIQPSHFCNRGATMKFRIAFAIAVLMLVPIAKADSFNIVTANPVFQGTIGSLVIAPIPISVSFEWDVTTDSPVLNTVSVEGPEGPFSLTNGFYPTSSQFVNFTDAFGDNLQIIFFEPTSTPGSLDLPGDYGLSNTVLLCVPPLCPISAENPFGEILFTHASSGDLTVSSAPEPPTWLLSLIGMLAVVVIAKVKLCPLSSGPHSQ